MIKTPKDQTFIDADFASIENRIAYWVVDDKNHLDLFINGEDESFLRLSIVYACADGDRARFFLHLFFLSSLFPL
ncbi:MAG: hypothetical protein HOC02_08960 [Methylococcales bacterium]|nr:hypothetical protein [Methylococcales bacterium]MBT7969162.1 hypothetical protein [Methylococcales bacterium]